MLKGCEAKATPAIITHKSVLLWLQLCQKVAVKTHESVIKIVVYAIFRIEIAMKYHGIYIDWLFVLL